MWRTIKIDNENKYRINQSSVNSKKNDDTILDAWHIAILVGTSNMNEWIFNNKFYPVKDQRS